MLLICVFFLSVQKTWEHRHFLLFKAKISLLSVCVHNKKINKKIVWQQVLSDISITFVIDCHYDVIERHRCQTKLIFFFYKYKATEKNVTFKQRFYGSKSSECNRKIFQNSLSLLKLGQTLFKKVLMLTFSFRNAPPERKTIH